MFDQEKSCEFDCYQLIHQLLSEIINNNIIILL